MNHANLKRTLGQRLRSLLWLLVPCTLLLAPCLSQAQWSSKTYSLSNGWNSIYLHGDASDRTIEEVFPASGATAAVDEVWQWIPNPQQAQYSESAATPSASLPEWLYWKRGQGGNTLSRMSGPAAYLVKCTASTSFPLIYSPRAPRATWVRSGANFLGFPSLQDPNSGQSPAFSSYFSTFAVATTTPAKIFKYVGGNLGANNPLQIVSAASEQVKSKQAYWFSAEVTGTFYGPLEAVLSDGDGLDFGGSGIVSSVQFRNRTSSAMTVRLVSSPSGAPPAGGSAPPSAPPGVPLTIREFNSSLGEVQVIPLSGARDFSIPANSYIDVHFGVDRSLMTLPAGTEYASLLYVTVPGQMDFSLPVKAQRTSFDGLWMGDAVVTHVSNHVDHLAQAKAVLGVGGAVASVSVVKGGFGFEDPPQVNVDAPPAGGTGAHMTATVAGGAVTGITVTSPGSGYTVPPRVYIHTPTDFKGTAVKEPMRLRTLFHVASGTALLRSQVFIGQLNTVGHPVGIAASESQLKQDAKGSARRLVAAHLPLDTTAQNAYGGAFDVPGTAEFVVQVPFDHKSNPFVHQYHPDHDNKDARFQPLAAGVESYFINRDITYTFTATPPAGSSSGAAGWGSSVIGGTYREVISGLKGPIGAPGSRDIQLDGTFELRRVMNAP